MTQIKDQHQVQKIQSGRNKTELEGETMQIQKIKKIIQAFPMEKELEDYDRHLV